MTAALLAAVVAVAIAAPHAFRLDRAAPGVAAAIWLAALTLRALTGVLAAVMLILYAPTTALFNDLTHWCWHTVLPNALHLGLDGHRLGDAAMVLPTLALAASLVWVLFGLVRAWHAVDRWLAHAELSRSRDTVVVADPDVMLGAAGLARPRIVVSAGAITALDDDELAAGIEHERGHIARRHRFLLVYAEMCRALGRFLPGSERAMTELLFQLERDADRFALGRSHDPYVLASAICKAALSPAPQATSVARLSGPGSVTTRLRELLGAGPRPRRGERGGAWVLATAMVTLAVGLAAITPSAVVSGAEAAVAGPPVKHCVG